MWRNFNFLPINHVSDDSYESVEEEVDPNEIVSPRRPHQSPSASPRALLVPDPPPIAEVLEGAGQSLQNVANRQRDERQARREREADLRAAAEAAAAADNEQPKERHPTTHRPP